MAWWHLHKRKDTAKTIDSRNAGLPEIEKLGENLTPNLRALRLAMTASDVLLSMGVSANSVVSRALDITETYCQRPVHIDIAANLLMLSQLRGIEREPLTLIRPVPLRDVNYMTIQSVQMLIHDIHKGKYTLDAAEVELDRILKHPRTYPWWLIMIGNAGIIAGVTFMYTSSWEIILTTFVIGLLVDRLLVVLAKRATPPFFRQIIAATFITLAAAILTMLASHGVQFFAGMNPTLLVVGGIMMLVAGLAIVGAIQDAIEEYFVTANARITKVILQTIGIVIGILLGIYTARKLGIGIDVSPDPLSLNGLHFQIIGAVIASAAYALGTQTHIRAIIWAGAIGGGALAIMYSSLHYLGISVVPASGIAAAFVGFIAALMSRFWRTPSVGITAAAILPLVPGLMLYTGLMQLTNYPPGDPLFNRAIGTLFTAATTGLAIAAGASFGSMIGRPLHQKIAYDRNFSPVMNLMRRQLTIKHKSGLANLALRLQRSRPNRDDES
jgi:uncharacterized membrane protein YjjP (DUF1212 family)